MKFKDYVIFVLMFPFVLIYAFWIHLLYYPITDLFYKNYFKTKTYFERKINPNKYNGNDIFLNGIELDRIPKIN